MMERDQRRRDIARRVASDLETGIYVNLGIGIPTLVPQYVSPNIEVMYHSENGVLGVGPSPSAESVNQNLVNASQEFVTVVPGACYFDCCESFSMMRGGHIDLALLGAYQVSEAGDLANWHRLLPGIPPAVGGAMDVAAGAREVWVLSEHISSTRAPRLVREVTLPLTAKKCVSRVYTDLATFELTDDGVMVKAIRADLSFSDLKNITEWELKIGRNCETFYK